MSMDIKSSDLVTLFEKALSDIPEPKLIDVGIVVQVGDGICRVHGLTDAVYNELVDFEGGNKGIIFDLGNTLIHMNRPWDEVNQEGAAAMAEWYKKKRVKLNAAALIDTFLANRATGFEQARQTNQETQVEDTLRHTLKTIEEKTLNQQEQA